MTVAIQQGIRKNRTADNDGQTGFWQRFLKAGIGGADEMMAREGA